MIFNNELEENIDNLTSQIPILRKMVETIDAKINKTGAKYIPGLAYWEIESMSGQVMNYRERIKKIGQAVTHIAKVQEIEQVSSLQEAGSAQAQEVEEEITFATALDRALFKQALRKLCDSRKELRCEGVKIIEQLGYKSKAVIPILIHILHDADGDVRTHVLGSLMKLEAQEALPNFVQALNDENVRVRLAAVRGVYKLSGKSAATFLIRALRDENAQVRERAATYLSFIRSDAAANGIIRSL